MTNYLNGMLDACQAVSILILQLNSASGIALRQSQTRQSLLIWQEVLRCQQSTAKFVPASQQRRLVFRTHGSLRSQACDDSEAGGYVFAEEEIRIVFAVRVRGGDRRGNAGI